MHNLLNQTESVNRKVPNGIIYTRKNLFHLEPGLFQNWKYFDKKINIHRVIDEGLYNTCAAFSIAKRLWIVYPRPLYLMASRGPGQNNRE